MIPSLWREPLVAVGGPDQVISDEQAEGLLLEALGRLAPRRVLLVPPDYTRYHSGTGTLTVAAARWLRAEGAQVDILPALGTHAPVSRAQAEVMFAGLDPADLLTHDWRNDLAPLGVVPGEFVARVSGGLVDFDVPIAVNRRLVEGGYDLILSLGQVVPHEVIGLANQAKNILVGTGGTETINRTHFLGAVCGMERLMGRADTPVRAVLREGMARFAGHLPVCYLLTVRAETSSGLVTRGLYIGGDEGTFEAAARLSQQVNLDLLDAPLERVVVWLQPDEYHSTWLGNKAIYRTRMALADDAKLIILAPGVETFGEDPEIDRLIRAYGYRDTPTTLAAVDQHAELRANLSAAAHLIHGSSEGRFRVTYAPGGLTRAEVEGVGYGWGDLDRLVARYQPVGRATGPAATADGEPFFFVANPALGLWALRSAFEDA
ncbi:MAG TPA: D-mannonate epimerase [Armatimonadetes bacterium]|nr:D-mannonate epimerase [Armatimonadota bacterium]